MAPEILPPSPWLLSNAGLLPRAGRALDVASGRGRHALFLAARGLTVTAVDRDPEALEALRHAAAVRALAVDTRVLDLEAERVDLGQEAYDLIVVVHFLHRPLFPALCRALAPAGLLLYETFTVDQARQGKPTNPDFLLKHGELRRLMAPLAVLREHDGLSEGRYVAAVAARKA